MDLKVYQESRKLLMDQAVILKRRLRELKSAVRGLDAAWAGLKGTQATDLPEVPAIPVSTDYDKSLPFKRLWSHKAIIIEVGGRMTGNFGVNEVKAAIDTIPGYSKYARLIQKATISGRLRKMAIPPHGLLQIVQQGTGTRPSIYRVKGRREESDCDKGLPVLAGSPDPNLILAGTV